MDKWCVICFEMKDDKVPLKTILQNFINHVENLEARLKEDRDLYDSEFQVMW